MVCEGENLTTIKQCCLHHRTKNSYELNITKINVQSINMKNAFEG